jgi:hypothetical protein
MGSSIPPVSISGSSTSSSGDSGSSAAMEGAGPGSFQTSMSAAKDSGASFVCMGQK